MYVFLSKKNTLQRQATTMHITTVYCIYYTNYETLSLYVCGIAVNLEGVQQLSVQTITNNSVRVRWTGVSGARGYRVVWGPFTGEHPFWRSSFHILLLAFCFNSFNHVSKSPRAAKNKNVCFT